MGAIKINAKKFDEIKHYLKIASRADVATMFGVSKSTINNVARCDSYEDYLQFRNIHANQYVALENSPLQELSGEELFWEVHSKLKNVPLRLIRTKVDCSIEELKLMKQAQDYEEYLTRKATGRLPLYRGRAKMIPVQVIQEIRQRIADGEDIKDLAQYYGVDLENLSRKLESFKQPATQGKRAFINDAIEEIILDGLSQGISPMEIAVELGVSLSTVKRTARGRRVGKSWREQYNKGRLSAICKQYVYPGEDYYLFSLRRYLGLDKYPYWWKKESVKVEEAQPEERSIVELKPIQEPVDEESAQEQKVVETEPVEVSVKTDNGELKLVLNLTLNINLKN